jgi:Fe-S oxidoreductase
VILWPDTFNNYFMPQTAIAAVEVLESAGFRVEVPKANLCCGRPLYDYGMLLTAKRFLREIIETLRPQIEAGVPIVGLEPSCTAVFREELLNLFPNDLDAQRLQKQTRTLSEFLVDLGEDWTWPKLHRKALVQAHCHHKAVMGFEAEQTAFERLGLEATVPDSGCCGMAGSFGYEAGEHYRVSMACGERAILPKVREADAQTLIVADGFSCREQIEQSTGVRPLHLAEVIALARSTRQRAPSYVTRASSRAAHNGVTHNRKAHTLEYALVGAGIAAIGGAIALERLSRNGGHR